MSRAGVEPAPYELQSYALPSSPRDAKATLITLPLPDPRGSSRDVTGFPAAHNLYVAPTPLGIPSPTGPLPRLSRVGASSPYSPLPVRRHPYRPTLPVSSQA